MPQSIENKGTNPSKPWINCSISVLKIYYSYIFSVSFNRGGQFRHSRLKDGANLEVANPMYMPQSTEEEEDESRQPLDQPYDFDPEKVSFLTIMPGGY